MRRVAAPPAVKAVSTSTWMPRGSVAPISRPIPMSRTFVETRETVMLAPVLGGVPSKIRVMSSIGASSLNDASCGDRQGIRDPDRHPSIREGRLPGPLHHAQEDVGPGARLVVEGEVDRAVAVEGEAGHDDRGVIGGLDRP